MKATRLEKNLAYKFFRSSLEAIVLIIFHFIIETISFRSQKKKPCSNSYESRFFFAPFYVIKVERFAALFHVYESFFYSFLTSLLCYLLASYWNCWWAKIRRRCLVKNKKSYWHKFSHFNASKQVIKTNSNTSSFICCYYFFPLQFFFGCFFSVNTKQNRRKNSKKLVFSEIERRNSRQ